MPRESVLMDDSRGILISQGSDKQYGQVNSGSRIQPGSNINNPFVFERIAEEENKEIPSRTPLRLHCHQNTDR